MKPLKVLLLVLFSNLAFAQDYSIDLKVHNRVNTSNPDVKKVVKLWKNYLLSHPDSIYNNPYWNTKEKRHYKDFDFTRKFIYQFPAPKLLNHYSPTILSIEKQNDHYAIRTLFYAEGLKGKYQKSNPWCITKIFAVKENGEWRLKNALPVITEDWQDKTFGKITFHYNSCRHNFNKSLAQRSSVFCDSITKQFEFPEWQPFDFYITESAGQLGELIGFDFFFPGYTTGMGWPKRRILLSGKGSEWYPHELVHMIVPDTNRHGMVEEGFATWQGGTMGKPFKENVKKLAKAWKKADTVTFDKILNRKWKKGRSLAAYYTTGAVICKKVYEEKGLKSFKELMAAPKKDERFKEMLCNFFGLEKKELSKFIKRQVLEYAER